MFNPDDPKSPTAEFIAKKQQIDKALQRLQQKSDEFFNVNQNKIHWGHVTDITDYAELLNHLTDKVFKEGEYAPGNTAKR
ncbi:hypothetical protein [Agarilytica rhodophyticola]|uniref:hypothetical protein n=1 Tax=Agarilytica rhodophyticola TaxID=1737490 RepID=UPI000B345E29|nr:hypothetical protein [Agarilytica rhodophyticola]